MLSHMQTVPLVYMPTSSNNTYRHSKSHTLNNIGCYYTCPVVVTDRPYKKLTYLIFTKENCSFHCDDKMSHHCVLCFISSEQQRWQRGQQLPSLDWPLFRQKVGPAQAPVALEQALICHLSFSTSNKMFALLCHWLGRHRERKSLDLQPELICITEFSILQSAAIKLDNSVQ